MVVEKGCSFFYPPPTPAVPQRASEAAVDLLFSHPLLYPLSLDLLKWRNRYPKLSASFPPQSWPAGIYVCGWWGKFWMVAD